MQLEHDEEDEIQEEARHHGRRSSHITKHKREELPAHVDNSFAKRLGQRSKSALRERGIERASASLSADAPRRTLIDEVSRSCKH